MKTPPRVILFQPKTGVLSEVKTRPSFPLSLLSAARNLEGDFQLVLVDQRLEADWSGRLASELRKGAVCVGITSITGVQIKYALEASRLVKRQRPEIPVVWGGVHATLLPGETLKEPSVDIVVRGEGEETFAELVRSLLHKRSLEDVSGISFRSDGNGSAIHNEPRPFVSLDSLPYVPYYVAKLDYLFMRRGRPSMYLETSRGCPLRCAFCYNSSVKNRTWRAMGPEAVIGSVEEILRAFPKVGHLSIVDDNFFVDLERVRKICTLLLKNGSRLTYQVQGASIQTLKRLSDEDLSLLKRSGCERVDMGVESGSAHILEEIDKGISVQDVREANRRLMRMGIEPWFNFMSGFPMESEEDLKSTIRLMIDLERENPKALLSPLYCYTPYPGNKLYERARQMGFEPPDSLEKWSEYGWDKARLPWISPRKARDLESYYFLSIFVDRKVFEYASKWWVFLLAFLYRPLARLRFRRGLLGLMIEKHLYARLFEKDSIPPRRAHRGRSRARLSGR